MRHQDYINDAVELLSRLIATPSVSRNEKEAADVMQQQMNTYVLATHREANNIWSVCPDYDPAKPTILLNAHIDTVKPAISGFTTLSSRHVRAISSSAWAVMTAAAAWSHCCKYFAI